MELAVRVIVQQNGDDSKGRVAPPMSEHWQGPGGKERRFGAKRLAARCGMFQPGGARSPPSDQFCEIAGRAALRRRRRVQITTKAPPSNAMLEGSGTLAPTPELTTAEYTTPAAEFM